MLPAVSALSPDQAQAIVAGAVAMQAVFADANRFANRTD